MKKKILVPIIALAMVVTAGVNYNLIGEQMNSLKSTLADICNVSSAQAEWEFDPDNCVETIDTETVEWFDEYMNHYVLTLNICDGVGYLYCPAD